MSAYALPEAGTFEDWKGSTAATFAPSARQQVVIDAVQAALDAGLFYSDDVRGFAAERLQVPAEILPIGAKRVEGGEFGMDCYYARKVIDARVRHAAERANFEALQPLPGDRLGTVVFNDFKRVTGLIVMSAAPGEIVLHGKRGNVLVEFTTTATGLRCAIERAHERKLRKDAFAPLCATLAAGHAQAAQQVAA